MIEWKKTKRPLIIRKNVFCRIIWSTVFNMILLIASEVGCASFFNSATSSMARVTRLVCRLSKDERSIFCSSLFLSFPLDHFRLGLCFLPGKFRSVASFRSIQSFWPNFGRVRLDLGALDSIRSGSIGFILIAFTQLHTLNEHPAWSTLWMRAPVNSIEIDFWDSTLIKRRHLLLHLFLFFFFYFLRTRLHNRLFALFRLFRFFLICVFYSSSSFSASNRWLIDSLRLFLSLSYLNTTRLFRQFKHLLVRRMCWIFHLVKAMHTFTASILSPSRRSLENERAAFLAWNRLLFNFQTNTDNSSSRCFLIRRLIEPPIQTRCLWISPSFSSSSFQSQFRSSRN